MTADKVGLIRWHLPLVLHFILMARSGSALLRFVFFLHALAAPAPGLVAQQKTESLPHLVVLCLGSLLVASGLQRILKKSCAAICPGTTRSCYAWGSGFA